MKDIHSFTLTVMRILTPVDGDGIFEIVFWESPKDHQ
jgi:hypothetical protein